jgi:hypothetical protein
LLTIVATGEYLDQAKSMQKEGRRIYIRQALEFDLFNE